jgi:hypothetical protein
MAQKRMFSLDIIDSDAFLDMPTSSQLLYFHLAMRADDDGFIDNPKKIMRIVGTAEDDLKLLLAKRFLLSFESGVVVIKHWLIHNYIAKDRYTPTKYSEEAKMLSVKENRAYTDRIQNVYKLLSQYRVVKSSKVKSSKDKIEKITSKFIFKGMPCIYDSRKRKYLALDNNEWLEVDDRFISEIKDNK